MIRPSPPKTLDQIAREWDELARLRCEQIDLAKDISFHFVLLPMILRLSEGCDYSNVLDIGCGPGFLTRELAAKSNHVVGVDISKESIKCALDRHGQIKNIKFVHSSLEAFASPQPKSSYSLAVSNMAVMTVLDLDRTFEAAFLLLRKGGNFVFTICHPWFWPFYLGYASEEWFEYGKEIAIEGPFRISLESDTELVSTHVHRPLHQYLKSLKKAGFSIDDMMEPIPDKAIEAKYPKRWDYPRFLGIRCTKK